MERLWKFNTPHLCDFIKTHYLNEQMQSIKELGDLNHFVQDGSPRQTHQGDGDNQELSLRLASIAMGVSSLFTRARMLGLTLPFLSCIKAST